MLKRAVIGLLLCAFVAVAVCSFMQDAQAAKKTRLFPYKIVWVNGKTGAASDSVFEPADNDISDELAKARHGVYEAYFDPKSGDSATYGIDSTSIGLHHDTVYALFDIAGYDAAILGYGLYDWDSAAGNADVDSHLVDIKGDIGTEMGNEGTFWTVRSLQLNNRGGHTDENDTALCCVESLWTVTFQAELPGGVDADSVMLMDKFRLRYIIIDSALVGDAVNARSVWFRAFLLAEEEY